MIPDNHFRLISTLLVFIISVWASCILYGNNSEKHKSDTIFLKAGEFIIYQDSSHYASHDTSFIVPDYLSYITTSDMNHKTSQTYDSLYNWAEKKPFVNNLLRLFINQNANNSHEAALNAPSDERYKPYKGMIIRNIRLAKLAPFGAGINDTIFLEETSLERVLNNTHTKTRDKVLIKSLLFKKGDLLNPRVIADNERIIRQLPFIQDARLIIIPVSDNKVDILLISKDQYSIGFGFKIGGWKAGRFDLYDQNFLGIGHRVSAELLYDYNQSNLWGYGFAYSSENLFGSFIRARARYRTAFNTEIIGISAEHPFITPDTKYSYGFTNEAIETKENFDTALSPYPLRYYYQDYWLGRSFNISNTSNRIILAGRFINNHVYERPDITEKEFHYLQKYELYLGSIAFSKENFYKMHLIYNFGKTEDIPFGTLIELTGGWERNEFFDRYYSSLNVSNGKVYPHLGYLYMKVAVGGFFEQNFFNRGVVDITSNYFSHLIPVKRFQIRQFVNFSYTNGISRLSDEYIYLRNDNGIRGLWTHQILGTQRTTLNFETVIFSPYYLYGFRFTFYTFADLGLIGEQGENLFNRKDIYSGFGFGIRLRNENLSFKTLQIRIGFYPVLPEEYASHVLFDVAGEKYYRPNRFDFSKPGLLEYK